MSTPAQILANQQNANMSTGPSTPEGKAASSANATTHGLSSATFTLLPQEDSARFEASLAEYRRLFAPTTPHESLLVDLMVQARWKMARISRLEAAIVEQMMQEDTVEQTSVDVIAAAMLKGTAKAYLTIQRYGAAAERSYYKAQRELEKSRSAPPSEPMDMLLRAISSPALSLAPRPPSQPPKSPIQNEANRMPVSGAARLGNLALRLWAKVESTHSGTLASNTHLIKMRVRIEAALKHRH